MSAESVGAGVLWKLAVALPAGVLGAAIIAAFDPPSTKKELFKQASVAGVGSMVFGPAVVATAYHFIGFLPQGLETAVPFYFLTGAMSWGIFGAIAKLRLLIRDHAAKKIAERMGIVIVPESPAMVPPPCQPAAPK